MTQPSSGSRSALPRWPILAGAAVVLVFIAAMVTQYMRTGQVRDELAAVRERLAAVESEATIGAAVAEAQQGRYEPARQLASRFFTTVQRRALTGPAEQRAPLLQLLERRDALITLLSRSDPAAVAELARLVTTYRSITRPAAAP
jgi:hypothetical protein